MYAKKSIVTHNAIETIHIRNPSYCEPSIKRINYHNKFHFKDRIENYAKSHAEIIVVGKIKTQRRQDM